MKLHLNDEKHPTFKGKIGKLKLQMPNTLNNVSIYSHNEINV